MADNNDIVAEVDLTAGADPSSSSTTHNLNAAESALHHDSSNTNNENNNPTHDSNNEQIGSPIEVEVPSTRPSTREEEKSIIKELEASANVEGFKVGETWYVIATKWWKSWKDFVSYDWQNSLPSYNDPGPIENENIVEPGSRPGEELIRKTALENYDFILMSESMWKTLQAWYGGGPALPRKVIPTGWNNSSLAVEIRPLSLKVCKSSSSTNFMTCSFSKTDTLKNFKTVMCEKMGLDPENVRIWDYHAFSKYKLLEDLSQRLDSAQIIDGQPMLLEEKDENGKFPEAPKSKSMMSSYSSHYNSGPTDPGTTGLVNLGNTCFMNSSLQCLSNTAPLTNYFLQEKYKTDINLDNPLGMKGELAEEYASLVKDLWSGTHSATAPRDFKWKLERFAPQFAGYQQHDSQELLAFLLDGLHEDLNRIKKKPYIENPEVNDRPQDVVAAEAWAAHKARNDSIIVDWFQGQLKSTLVCPACQRVSITFDPFMYLSLPLPMKTTRMIYVTMFFVDPARKPTRYGCEVPKHGSISTLKASLSTLSGLKPSTIVITDVYNSRFFKRFSDNEALDTIQDRDFICGYEILVPPEGEGHEAEAEDLFYFPVISRKEEPSHHPFHPSGSYSKKTLFGFPFILSVPNASKLTYDQLYDELYRKIQPYLKLPKGKIYRTTEDVLADEAEITKARGEIRKRNEDSSSSEDDDLGQKKSNTESSSTDDDELPSQKTKKTRAPQPLFTIKAVDNYGTTDMEPLADNDKPLKLDDRRTLAMVWNEDIADHLYDEAIEKDFEIHPSARKVQENEAAAEQSITLEKCIELFTGIEQLGPDDPWYCSRCKAFQQATKKFDLWSLPPILVVHLKRFSYKNRYWREKLETFVDCAVDDLDLSEFVQGPTTVPPHYELYAVSNHYGSLGGGHYTAYAKNKEDSKWYKFDDSHVQQVDGSRVVSSSAYVLFYKRKDVPNNSTNPSSNNNNNSNGSSQNNENDTQEMDHDSNNRNGTSSKDDSSDEGDVMDER